MNPPQILHQCLEALDIPALLLNTKGFVCAQNALATALLTAAELTQNRPWCVVTPYATSQWGQDRDGNLIYWRIKPLSDGYFIALGQPHQSLRLHNLHAHLLSTFSHDFNNLATILTGNLRLLENDPRLDEETRDILNDSLGAARDLLGLVQRYNGCLRDDRRAAVEVNLLKWWQEVGPWWVQIAGGPHALVLSHGPNAQSIHIKTTTLSQWFLEVLYQAQSRQASPPLRMCLGPAPSGELSLTVEPLMLEPQDLILFQHLMKPWGGTAIRHGEGVSLLFTHTPTQEVQPKAPPAKDKRGNKPMVLVVEDEGNVRRLLVRSVRHLGYATLEAADAQTAQDIVRSMMPDIVLSDVRMPGALDGRGLAVWLRQHHPHIPIVLATGYSSELELEPFTVLHKPFSLEALANALIDIVPTLKDGDSGTV